jgi:hypothetical protein
MNLEPRLESVLQVAHWTVSGAPGRASLKLSTLGFSQGALRYNSPDYLVDTGLSGGHRTIRWTPDMSGEPTEQQ